jgi:hypothetical protein
MTRWTLLAVGGGHAARPRGECGRRRGGPRRRRLRTPLNLVIAGGAIAAVPPIVLSPIFQRQILRGINPTGLQG